MRDLAISTSDVFVLVYSMTDSDSFDQVKQLREDILSHRQLGMIVMLLALYIMTLYNFVAYS
jgi:GTPase SAR1 family protein